MKKLINIALITILAKFLKFSFEIGSSFVLSEEVYGGFSILISYILILTSISAFGIPNILIREYPKKSFVKDRNLLLQNSVIIVSLITVIVYFFVTVFKIKYLSEHISIPFIILASSLIVVCSIYIRSVGDTVFWIFFKDILWYLFYFFGLIILYVLDIKNYSVKQILHVYTYSVILSFLCLFFYLKIKHKFNFINKFSFFKIKKIYEDSFPVLFTGLTYLILSRIDVIMLGNYVDVSLVGQYNKVVRITIQVLFFYQVVSAYFLPRLAKKFAKKDTYSEIAKFNTKFLGLSVITVLITSVILFIWVRNFGLFTLLNVPETEELFTVFYIFLITQILYVFMSSYSYILLYINKQKIEYFNNFFILTVGVVLNHFMIPEFGLIGAAFSSAFAILLGNFLEAIQVRFYTKTLFLKI